MGTVKAKKSCRFLLEEPRFPLDVATANLENHSAVAVEVVMPMTTSLRPTYLEHRRFVAGFAALRDKAPALRADAREAILPYTDSGSPLPAYQRRGQPACRRNDFDI